MMSRVGGQSFVDGDDFGLAGLDLPPAGADEKWTPVAGVRGTPLLAVGVPLLQPAASKMAAMGRTKRRTSPP